MAAPVRDTLRFPISLGQQIDPYLYPPSHLPPLSLCKSTPKPYVTLTFATSLDSNLAISPGVQTALSGPESKAMTHYLRSKHDAILIGVGTAVADNPSLNCRIEGVGGYGGEGLSGQPIPVVLDPNGRWEFTAESKCIQLAKAGRGKGPLLITTRDIPPDKRAVLESVGGKTLILGSSASEMWTSKISWQEIFSVLAGQGIHSVMIEGGGSVINDLLSPHYLNLVNSIIVTVAPTWLGKGGVQVCPEARIEQGTRVPVGRLKDTRWIPLGEDVVLCGRPSL